MNPERLLTVADVVFRTGLAERTVRAMIADGRLPVVRPVGLRVVRVPEEAVLKLMYGRDARMGHPVGVLATSGERGP